MSYVDGILTAGESIQYRARISWIGYIPGLVLLIIPPIGIALLIIQAIKVRTTEIAITDRRLIFKAGLIARKAIDVDRDRIETISLTQSILGRLFGYGTVIVHGTGVGEIVLDGIDAPVELRRVLS